MNDDKLTISEEPKGELLVYRTEDGKVNLEVRLENETVWLTQKMMAELFHTTKQNISLHIQAIYEEGELHSEATVKKYLTVQQEGKRQVNRSLDYYNLDMIISVGYRVKSLIATRFRIWATQQLKEYIIKGFVMDDERLKNPPVAGSSVPDYFDEMLERIRDSATKLRAELIFSSPGNFSAAPPLFQEALCRKACPSCFF